jgi:tetratricopeptide (TPR) repeat protein
MRRVWPFVAVVVLLIVARTGEQLRAEAQRYYTATASYEDIYYLPPTDYLLLGSLGYRAALADLIWMKALVYYGEELGHRGNVRHLYRYGDAMLALDPDFKKVYRWVASSALYRTGEITADDARAAVRYLERATRRFPDDGELAWDLGANYTYELAPMLTDDGERKLARRKGLEYLEAAVMRHAGPAWLVLHTSSQLEALGRKEQAIRHLEDAYAVASDAHIKQEIELQLVRLRSAAYGEALRRTDQELTADRERNFPYLEDTMYLLVGPRPLVDLQAWLARGAADATTLSN